MYHSKENELVVLPYMGLAYFNSDKSTGFSVRINPSQVQYKVPVRSLDLVLDYFYKCQKQENQWRHRFAIYRKTQDLYTFIVFDAHGQVILSCPAHTHHWQQCMQSALKVQKMLKTKLHKMHFKLLYDIYKLFSESMKSLFAKEIINLIGFHLFTTHKLESSSGQKNHGW